MELLQACHLEQLCDSPVTILDPRNRLLPFVPSLRVLKPSRIGAVVYVLFDELFACGKCEHPPMVPDPSKFLDLPRKTLNQTGSCSIIDNANRSGAKFFPLFALNLTVRYICSSLLHPLEAILELHLH